MSTATADPKAKLEDVGQLPDAAPIAFDEPDGNPATPGAAAPASSPAGVGTSAATNGMATNPTLPSMATPAGQLDDGSGHGIDPSAGYPAADPAADPGQPQPHNAPQQGEITQYTMARVQQALGVSPEQVKQRFASEDDAVLFLGAVDRAMLGAAPQHVPHQQPAQAPGTDLAQAATMPPAQQPQMPNAQQPAQQPAQAQAPAEVPKLEFDWKGDESAQADYGEEVDPRVKSNLQALGDHLTALTEHQNAQLQAMLAPLVQQNQDMAAQMQTFHQQGAAQVQQELDSAFGQLGEEWKPIFGGFTPSNVPRGSIYEQHMLNAIGVMDAMEGQDMTRGLPPGNVPQYLQRALAANHYETMRQSVRQEVTTQTDNRLQQTINRPSGRVSPEEDTPEERERRAAQRANQVYRDAGLPPTLDTSPNDGI